MKTNWLWTLLAIASLIGNAHANEIETNTAQMQAIDKITGRSQIINIATNTKAEYGSLSIVVRQCKTRPPEETPENFAFVDIIDSDTNGEETNIFKGWMISSSPALNAIEHPIYDIWLLRCIDSDVDENTKMSIEELEARDYVQIVRNANSQYFSNKNDGNPESLIPDEILITQEELLETTEDKTAELQTIIVDKVTQDEELMVQEVAQDNVELKDTSFEPQFAAEATIEKNVPNQLFNNINEQITYPHNNVTITNKEFVEEDFVEEEVVEIEPITPKVIKIKEVVQDIAKPLAKEATNVQIMEDNKEIKEAITLENKVIENKDNVIEIEDATNLDEDLENNSLNDEEIIINLEKELSINAINN